VAALVPVPLVVQQAIRKRTSAVGYMPARVPFGTISSRSLTQR
jgi:hypothetical protein